MLFQTADFAWFFSLCIVLYFGRAPAWRWLLAAPALYCILISRDPLLISAAVLALSSDILLTTRLRRTTSRSTSEWMLLLVAGCCLAGYGVVCWRNGFFVAPATEAWSATFDDARIVWLVQNFNLLYLFLACAHNSQLWVDPTDEQQHYGWMVLLPLSYAFYMAWEPWYALLIVYSTVVDYVVGIRLEKERRSGRRLAMLGLVMVSLVGNLGLLFFFKYHNFFANSVNALDNIIQGGQGNVAIPLHQFLLPVGISFYTFQTLSYTIEVYRGKQRAERHLGYFATYVVFFPQLVAGPIERPQNLLPELRHGIARFFDYERITGGLKLFVYGLFLKVVLADNLARLVDPVYQSPALHVELLALGTVAFAFQIFGDFAGYSCMAIGIAQVLGIKLMRNFYAPYRARTIQEFWQRWHISLSTWFRDYVYRPLRERFGRGKAATIAAAGVVFLTSGLWHGAAWNFAIWGALHLFYYLFGRLFVPKVGPSVDAVFARWHAECAQGLTRIGEKTHLAGIAPRRFASVARGLFGYEELKTTAMRGVTFVLVCFAWIFFRSSSSDTVTGEAAMQVASEQAGEERRAMTIVRLMPLSLVLLLDKPSLGAELSAIEWSATDTLIIVWALFVVWFVHRSREQNEIRADNGRVVEAGSARAWLQQKPFIVRHTAYCLLCLSILLLGAFDQTSFLYFQF